MRVLTFDLDADGGDLEGQWREVVDRSSEARPDLVVLPEMPFAAWLAASRTVDASAWENAVADHDRWVARFHELGATVVVTTRPVLDDDGTRGNEAIVWSADGGVIAGRRKTYLPDEPGFHEARWYQRGPIDFPVTSTAIGWLGVMVCTELWFPEHGRRLGQQGAQLIAVPRATPATSVDRWEAGARVLAMISGAYCLSVNRGGADDTTFSGGSVIVDPEGAVLARSVPGGPTLVADLDLTAAATARSTYPRYVEASDVT
jgi:predicted amidohydrolase